MEFLGHWVASGLVTKRPANNHRKPAARRSIIPHQLTLGNHRKMPHWNNVRHNMNRGVTPPNNYFNRLPVLSHSLWIMSSKGLIPDTIPLFTLSLSHFQLRRCVQPLGPQPGCVRTLQSIIVWPVSAGGCWAWGQCPHCPLWFNSKKVIPNSSATLLAPVTTTGQSCSPFPGRLALFCIIPVPVIKGSQEELRWSERGELRIVVHISHTG